MQQASWKSIYRNAYAVKTAGTLIKRCYQTYRLHGCKNNLKSWNFSEGEGLQEYQWLITQQKLSWSGWRRPLIFGAITQPLPHRLKAIYNLPKRRDGDQKLKAKQYTYRIAYEPPQGLQEFHLLYCHTYFLFANVVLSSIVSGMIYVFTMKSPKSTRHRNFIIFQQ